MENIDLNIDNYSLDDILGLFNISIQFTEDDLRKVYKTVVMTHPDKSNMPPEYFLFFTKAFKILKQLHLYKKKRNINDTCVSRERMYENVVIGDERNDEHSKNKNIEKVLNREDFNSWFNNLFEEVKSMNTSKAEQGYGSWLSSNEDIVEANAKNTSDISRCMESQREKVQSMIVYNGVQTREAGQCDHSYILDDDIPGDFSSDVFSKLRFEDLKKAHTECINPITEQQVADRLSSRVTNTNDLQNMRTQQQNTIDWESSKTMYATQQLEKSARETSRAFSLARQMEQSERQQQRWWAGINQIEDAM